MNSLLELLAECNQRSIELWLDGPSIRWRGPNPPPHLLDRLRAHKPEIRSALEAKLAALPLDCRPWLHIAKQVLAGEFHGGSRSLQESILIGVRSINHPICKKARMQLESALRNRGQE